MKIGIFGGTFDPIHKGHIEIARYIYKKLKLDKVIFIPAGKPPHKKRCYATGLQRLTMIKSAIKKYPHFYVSDLEIKKKGKSYTIETISAIKKEYKEKSLIFFILGSDALQEIKIWKNYQRLLLLCQLVVVNRTGFVLKKVPPKILDRIIKIKMSPISISSTKIRNAIKNKKSIKSLITPKVAQYIYKNRLYLSIGI